MGLYYSTKQKTYVQIEEMATPHIANAIRKIRSGTHSFYTAGSDYKLIELLLELEKRNTEQLAELKEQVANLGYRAQLAERRIAAALPVREGYTASLLSDLRRVALNVIRDKGLVTADTLRHAWGQRSFLGLPVADIGPALPYVFRDKRFKKIGFLRSTFPQNKGRFINVWGSTASL